MIELHGSRDVILARFARTYSYRLFTARPRDPGQYPALQDLDPADRAGAVAEGAREMMTWQPGTERDIDLVVSLEEVGDSNLYPEIEWHVRAVQVVRDKLRG